MSYSFKVRLDGLLCDECREALSGVVVRLYRSAGDARTTELAVADPKETLAILSADEVAARQSRLLAEERADANGAALFHLSEKLYQGGPFEIDVLVERAPHQKQGGTSRPAVQLAITTLQPVWRKGEQGAQASWQYTLPSRVWCAVRKRLGAWVVCGLVRSKQTHAGLAGVIVNAFDTDIFEDDALGAAITDGTGHFRLDYLQDDFEKTIWSALHIELFPGPDLYFRITDSAGTAIYTEDRAVGRSPGRGNVDSCKCVTLDVDMDTVSGFPPDQHPWFTHVGDYHIYSQISSATGYGTSASGHRANLAFTGNIKLKGFVPKRNPANTAQQLQYRFRFVDLGDPTRNGPIAAANLVPVVVGARPIQWKLFDDTLVSTFQSVVIAPSGATPAVTPLPAGPGPWGVIPDHVIVPDSNGWIQVDQTALDGGFYGPLVRLATSTVAPGGAPVSSAPGIPITAADQKSGRSLQIVFEVAEVGSASVLYSNDLPKIRINNWGEVRLLALDQPVSVCSPIANQLGIKFTVDHEMMESWGLGLTNAAGVTPPISPALPSGGGPRGGSANPHGPVSTAGWAACSYTVSVGTLLSLTDGEVDDGGRSSSTTFCIE